VSAGFCQHTGDCWDDPDCALHGSGLCPALVAIPAQARERILRQHRELGQLTARDEALEGDELRKVRMRPVNEAEDDW
jgi:hypothetical protein